MGDCLRVGTRSRLLRRPIPGICWGSAGLMSRGDQADHEHHADGDADHHHADQELNTGADRLSRP